MILNALSLRKKFSIELRAFVILNESEMTTMLFMASPYERALEKSMMSVPNFSRRGHGVIVMNRFEYSAELCECRNCTERNGRMESGVLSFSEILRATFSEVVNNTFRLRLNNYMKESEDKPMLYRGYNHKELFEKAVGVRNIKSAAFLSALYLLTADNRLWSKVNSYVSGSAINFNGIRLCDISVEAYALFMAAKDLYGVNFIGTEQYKHLTISDLADKEIIGHKIFAIICNAMMFRRYGMNAFIIAEKDGVVR